MYVCICHAVTDGAIRAAAKSGTKSFRCLSKSLQVATKCGACAIEAKRIFDEAVRENDPIEKSIGIKHHSNIKQET